MNEDIIILGPTASGKTKLAIAISNVTGLPIVNCDSRQFWKNIKKISCSPTEEEKSLAPHLLFNCLEDYEKPSLGYWVKEIKKMGTKIIVGGSMFYPYCLLQGIPEVSISKDTKNKCLFIKDKYGYLTERKVYVDKNDKYRIERLLEFYIETGNTFENFPIKFQRKAKVLTISIVEEKLKFNILKRIEKNIDDWIEECFKNQNENFISVIGYKECLDFTKGIINKLQLQEMIFEKTFRYAKKQLKFMRRFKSDLSL